MFLPDSIDNLINMRPHTPSLKSLRAFEAAARHLSFTRAAEELFVTPGAISQQVAALEAHLGLRLFERVRQRLKITEAGRNYLAPLKQSLDRIEMATVDLLNHGGQTDELRIGVLPSLATLWLIPRLPEFSRLHPDIRLNLTALNLNFAAAERSPDLAGGFINIGLFYGDGHWPNLKAEPLLSETLVPVASPTLLNNEAGSDLSPFDRFPLLQHSMRPNSWAEWFLHNQLPARRPKGPSFEHFHMVIAAASAGLGIAIVPKLFVLRELQSALLEELPGEALNSRRAYYLVSDPTASQDTPVQAFRSWLLETAGKKHS